MTEEFSKYTWPWSSHKSVFTSAIDVKLLVDALRLHYKHKYDPKSVVAIGNVEPLPHQIEAFTQLMAEGRIRKFLADDVGLGKTIIAGLILKELILRGKIKKVLVVLPAVLKLQWQEEMEEKFSLKFVIAEGKDGHEILKNENLIIASIQYLRLETQMEVIESLPSWDMVVIDEAHRLTPETLSFALADTLSRAEHLLLMSATPHDGKSDTYRDRLRLLSPIIGDTEEDLRKASRKFVIRRSKKEVFDYNGYPLFTHKLTVRQVKIEWMKIEKEFYEAIRIYVQNYYVLLNSLELARNSFFVLLVFLRRLSSSVNSGMISLRRRKDRLFNALRSEDEEVLQLNIPENSSDALENLADKYYKIREQNEYDDDVEAEEHITNEILELIPFDKELIKQEIIELDKVIALGSDLEKYYKQNNIPDSKFGHLKDILEKHWTKRPNDKIIIFTEFRDTLDFLEENLSGLGYNVYTISGLLDINQKKQQRLGFEQDGNILIGTEAAGEGLNLQIANIVINFELPWNPNRLHQRIGRVYRYGQDPKKPIIVHNLTSDLSVEERIIGKLHEKLSTILHELGDHPFEMLGSHLSDKEIRDFIESVMENEDQAEELLNEFAKEKHRQLQQTLQREFVVSKRYGVMGAEKERIDQRITNFDLERYFYLAMKRKNADYFIEKDGSYKVYTRNLVNFQPSSFEYTKLINAYYKPQSLDPIILKHKISISFPSQYVNNTELFALGHKLLTRSIEQDIKQRPIGVIFGQIEISEVYRICISKATCRNMPNVKHEEDTNIEIFLLNQYNEVINPIRIWNWEIASEEVYQNEVIKSEVMRLLQPDYILPNKLDNVESEIGKRHEAKLNSWYALKTKIEKEGLLNHMERIFSSSQGKSKKNPEAGRILKSQVKVLREKLLELDGEAKVISNPIIVVGLICVLPSIIIPQMKEDMGLRRRNVELAGMEVAKQFEIDNGRVPDDSVQWMDVGYDILSQSQKSIIDVQRITGVEIRYIEVKALNDTGTVSLTSNEWRSAEINGDNYYLYVVEYALTAPNLIRVQNPYEKMKDLVLEVENIQTKFAISVSKLKEFEEN